MIKEDCGYVEYKSESTTTMSGLSEYFSMLTIDDQWRKITTFLWFIKWNFKFNSHLILIFKQMPTLFKRTKY